MSIATPPQRIVWGICGAVVWMMLVAAPVEAVVLFAEDFQGVDASVGPVDVTTSNTNFTAVRAGSTTSPHISAIVQDTSNIFSPYGGNNYLHIKDGGGDVPRLSAPASLSGVFQLSFDVVDLFDPLGQSHDMRISLANESDSGGSRSMEIQFQSGAFKFRDSEEDSWEYNPNQLYHFDIVGNYGPTPIVYGASTLQPRSFSVYVDGDLIREGLAFAGDNTSSTHFHLAGGSSAGVGEMLVDNITLRDDILLGNPTLTIDRSTGNVSLRNDTGLNIEGITGYSITSPAGTLNSSPGVWQAIADINPNWEKLSGSDGQDLSEQEFGPEFTGLTLTNNTAFDFGDVWYKHYAEDIEMELMIEDGSPEGRVMPINIEYVGGADNLAPFVIGDLNFDGNIDVQDAVIFGNHFYAPLLGEAPGATYAAGDMNGDLVSDHQDLVLFRSVYDAANGAGALAALGLFGNNAAVPEPGSLAMLGLTVCGALAWRRRIAQRMGRGLIAACLMMGVAILAGPTHAAVVFEEDFNTVLAGTVVNNTNLTAFNSSVTNTTSGDNIVEVHVDETELFGKGASNHYLRYFDGNTNNHPRLIGPADLTNTHLFELSFDFHRPVNPLEPFDVRLGLGNSSATGTAKTVDFEFRETNWILRGNGDNTFNYNQGETYSAIAVGNTGPLPIIYNNGADWLAPGTFDVWLGDDLVGDNLIMPNGPLQTTHIAIHGTNGDFAEMYFDNIKVHDTIASFALQGEALLTLEVNTESGQVAIKNSHALDIPLGLDFYKITGGPEAFTLAGWNSLDDQEGADPLDSGWMAAGSSNAQLLTEFTLDGTHSTVEFGSPLSLGQVFNTTSGAEGSLIFQYALGEGPVLTGMVEYVTGPTPLFGDFNGDGIVDAADYTVWRNNLGGDESTLNGNGNGDSVVDIDDYDLWKSHFGSSTPGAVVLAPAQVPEPATYASLLVGAFALAAILRRKSF